MTDQRYVRWLHFDSERNICIGRGTLIRTLTEALLMPWAMPGGAAATLQQIETAWNTVRALRLDLRPLSVNDMRARTNIRLEQY